MVCGLPVTTTSETAILVHSLSFLSRPSAHKHFSIRNRTGQLMPSLPGSLGMTCNNWLTADGFNFTSVHRPLVMGTTCLQFGYLPSISRVINCQRALCKQI